MIWRAAAGSSSKRYSVSGWRCHSLLLSGAMCERVSSQIGVLPSPHVPRLITPLPSLLPQWPPLTPPTTTRAKSTTRSPPSPSTPQPPSSPAHMSASPQSRRSVSGSTPTPPSPLLTPSPGARSTGTSCPSCAVRPPPSPRPSPHRLSQSCTCTSVSPLPSPSPILCKDHLHGQDHPRRGCRPRHRVRLVPAVTSHTHTRPPGRART